MNAKNSAALEQNENEFTITRTFDAPRELVWKALSQAEALAEWWGPKGFKITVAKLEFKPGGIFHYSMQIPGGGEMWGRFIYREISKPGKITFINSFSDKNGGVTRAPFHPNWPLEVLNTLTLTEQNGKTTINLRGGPINATDLDITTFWGGFDSMRQGFGGTYDQLAEYLAKQGAK